MIRLLTAWTHIAVVAVSMAVSIPAIMFAQTTESTTESKPAASDNASPVQAASGPEDNTSVETNPPAKSASLSEVEAENQRLINELRSELLDDRADYIDRWLSVIGLVLTFFGIVVAIFGVWGFRKFQKIETEARNILGEIKKTRDKSLDILQDLNAEAATENPAKANQAVKNTREDPGASLTGKAIADAISLQQQGKRDDAIEKWRAIAHVVEGSDNNLSAQAWFSVGYLLHQDKDLENSTGAYDRAICLKPDFAEAFNNRGNAKADSGEYAAAIADYDKAIHLKPDFAKAFNSRGASKAALKHYGAAIADCDTAIRLDPDLVTAFNNRGNAKADSGEYAAAIADFDKAIHLKPGFAEAYINRGIAKVELNLKDEARKDFEIALELAGNAGETNLQTKAEQWLRDLGAAEGS